MGGMGTRLTCEHAGCDGRGGGSVVVERDGSRRYRFQVASVDRGSRESSVHTVCQGRPGGRGWCSDSGMKGSR